MRFGVARRSHRRSSPGAPPTPVQIREPVVFRCCRPCRADHPGHGAGALDSVYARLAGEPSYVSSGMFTDIDDVRAHGRDERVGVHEFYQNGEYIYRLLKVTAARP